jgi:aarF domain-containing kinase
MRCCAGGELWLCAAALCGQHQLPAIQTSSIHTVLCCCPMQADPHPGNLIRTPDGRLCILDFGLMCRIDNNIKFGMIEAVSHLIHRWSLFCTRNTCAGCADHCNVHARARCACCRHLIGVRRCPHTCLTATKPVACRDYEAIVQDFVTLDFIPPGTDLRPILPVLAKVTPAAASRLFDIKTL